MPGDDPTPSDAAQSYVVRMEIAEARNPLRREIQAYAQAATIQDVRKLQAAGAPCALWLGAGLLGFASIEVSRGDCWQPAEIGSRCVVVAASEEGCICDLVAFSMAAPGTWFMRTAESWALGMDDIMRASRPWGNEPYLVLHATPLDWLKAGGRGACIVHWTDEACHALRELPGITVGSAPVARKLHKVLARPLKLPEIRVGGAPARAT